MLSALAAALGGSASGGTAFGARCGTPVRVELVTRGMGKTAEEWTVLEAVLPAGYPLALHIRRHHWLGVTRVARDGVVDLPLRQDMGHSNETFDADGGRCIRRSDVVGLASNNAILIVDHGASTR